MIERRLPLLHRLTGRDAAGGRSRRRAHLFIGAASGSPPWAPDFNHLGRRLTGLNRPARGPCERLVNALFTNLSGGGKSLNGSQHENCSTAYNTRPEYLSRLHTILSLDFELNPWSSRGRSTSITGDPIVRRFSLPWHGVRVSSGKVSPVGGLPNMVTLAVSHRDETQDPQKVSLPTTI